MSSLKCFEEKLKAWNKHMIGNIFRRKRRIHLRLEGAKKELASRPSIGLLILEDRLKREREEVLLEEFCGDKI